MSASSTMTDDDLNPGVRQTVGVYVAQRRKITIAMHGRPRQQGRQFQDPPAEDMPFLADGTPFIILNLAGRPWSNERRPGARVPLGWLAHQGWMFRHVEAGEEWAAYLP